MGEYDVLKWYYGRMAIITNNKVKGMTTGLKAKVIIDDKLNGGKRWGNI